MFKKIINFLFPKYTRPRPIFIMDGFPEWWPDRGQIFVSKDKTLEIEIMTVWVYNIRVRVNRADDFWKPSRFRMQNVGYGLVKDEEFDLRWAANVWQFPVSKPWYSLMKKDQDIQLVHYN